MFAVNHISERHPPAPLLNRTSETQNPLLPAFLAARVDRLIPELKIRPLTTEWRSQGRANGRAMQRMTQCMGKLFIAHRVGRNHIKWPAQLVIQQPENAVDHIINMNPGQILPTGTNRPARPRRNGGSILPRIPPSGASTTPVRSRHTRVLSLCARQAISSQRAQSLWVNSLCGGSSSVTTTSPKSP